MLATTLIACGDATATAKPRPTAAPVATATPPVPGYLAQVDFSLPDGAENAHRQLVLSQPGLPAYASWVEGNRWYVMARDSNEQRLAQLVRGKGESDIKIGSVGYLAEAQGGIQGSYAANMLVLNRASLSSQPESVKEAARLLYARAVNLLGIRGGLLIFTMGNDQIYLVLANGATADQLLKLASLGKLELIGTGTKNIGDGTTLVSTASPSLSQISPADTTSYQTLATNQDFAALRPLYDKASLGFDLRPTARVYDYTRTNPGKYIALMFDRQVVSSAAIATAIRDRGEIQVPRWNGVSGQSDFRKFMELMNSTPVQLYEAREILRVSSYAFSGSFTR